MSFFIDKHNRRKSTIMLTAFCVGFVFAVLFVALAIALGEPLYTYIRFDNDLLTTAVHAVLVALVGTGICCVTFLLKDKRIAPYSFAGLAVWLCMFYAAAFLLEGEGRVYMMKTITMFGLGPVLVGNAVTWPIYLRMKRADPTMNHRKTIREELKEAVEQEAARRPAKPQPEEASAEERPAPISPAVSEMTGEDALFGTDECASAHRPAYRSAEEEAMLLYGDEEESYD